MVSRIWYGWTISENTDNYENLLRTEIVRKIVSKNIFDYQ